MLKYFLTLTGLVFSISAFPQNIQLINSGELLESGKASYDSGNYKSAIKKFLTIQERDTNYVASLAELALTYLGAEEYEKAIETCDKALLNPTEFRPHILRSKAIALDKKGDYAKSVALFEELIAAYPLDAVHLYNYGITRFNGKEYEKAKDLFFKTLAINPFHAGSHRALARIAILEGRKVHGMLAMGIYLSINPADNDNLVMINSFVLNQAKDEGSVPGTGKNSYEKLDQIIRAKMAMDKNFESKYSFDYAIVRQFEMLFQQLDLGSGEKEDVYRNLYSPIYKHLQEKGYLDPFVYNLIKSTGNEQVKKWNRKNEKEMQAFYDGTGAYIRTLRGRPSIPASFGLGEEYTAVYNDNGRLTSVGRMSTDGKMQGKWYFFHANTVRSSEGLFDKNEEKSRTWKYFDNSGRLTKVENYDNGEMTFYHSEGTVYQHFFLVKDSIEGAAEVMYPCGSIKDKYTYKDNKRNGKAVSYYRDGAIQSEYNYKEGKLEGDYKTYFEDGKLESVAIYRNDNAEGPYKKYFANGKTEVVGQYSNGERDGEWSYFYFNGTPDRKGVYKQGLGIGEWVFYNEHGELTEKRNFDQKGNLHGENTFYVDGKIHFVKTYKSDMATKFVYFDKNGKEVGKAEKDNGTFALKIYYPTGELSGEGNLKAGKSHGTWKYYFRHGGLQSQYNYKDGNVVGTAVEYYPGGRKKSEANYENDVLHGYYKSFHRNGAISEEGWYQNGDKEQQWLTRHMDGTVETDDFFLNGLIRTNSLELSSDGTTTTRRDYDDDGNLIKVTLYNPDGKPGSVSKKSDKKQIIETYFSNKKPQAHMELLCGAYYGQVTRYFPDGKVFYSYKLVNGKRTGKFQYFDIKNQIEREGNYIDGWAEGIWKGYEEGKLDYTGRYFNNNFDSTWTYYDSENRITSTVNFLRGERQGLATTRNREGGEAIEKIYESDDLIAYRVRRADGTWSEWTNFSGAALITAHYPNGQKAVEEEYKNGFMTGIKRHYYSSGKVASEYVFKFGDYDGPYVQYYSSGKIREKGQYVSDELNGKIEWYNEDGTLKKSENYNYGVRAGKAALYVKGSKSKEYTFWGANVYE